MRRQFPNDGGWAWHPLGVLYNLNIADVMGELELEKLESVAAPLKVDEKEEEETQGTATKRSPHK